MASHETSDEEPQAPQPPLQAVQTLRAEFDIFATRLREKIVLLERNLSKAGGNDLNIRSSNNTTHRDANLDGSSKEHGLPKTIMDASHASTGIAARSTAPSTDGSRSLDPTAFAGASTTIFRWNNSKSGDLPEAWAQEPPALVEHRLRRVQQAMPKRRYTSIGPIHSVQHQAGTDFRLHNRWLQLSMQCDTNAAMAEFRSAARNNSKPKPSLKKVSRSEMTYLLFQSLHPGGHLRAGWDTMAMLLMFLDAVFLPISFAWDWQKDTTSATNMFMLVLFFIGLVFWSLDIVVNFNTSYFSRGALVTSSREIVKHYLSTWFVLDFTLVVLDYFTAAHTLLEDTLTDLTFSRFVRVLRISRLVRLIKMAKIEGVLQEFAASTGRQWVMLCVTLLNTATLILLFEHIASCAWFGLSRINAEDSWIQMAGTEGSLPAIQYLHAFRYIMMPISPPEMTRDNWFERTFDIMYTFIWCLLLGSTVSRILATMFELTAMNESKSMQRREIRRYLRKQEASFHLVTRVMNFVDYKLEKLSLINFDRSLISDTLQTELCVNQRSRYLEALPVCKVTKDLFPEAFAGICTVLKKTVCENGEDIYVAGGLANCLYITATGEYSWIEGYDRDGEAEEITGIQCFEELSLYVDNLPHHSYLIARTFAEMYILEGNDLVKSLESTPGCAAMFFEYAREYTSAMHRIGARVDHKVSMSVAERCCKMTRVYQEIFPDQKFKLANISSSEELLHCHSMDDESVLAQPHEKRGIAWLLKEGWLEDLEESTLPNQLRSCLAELNPENGSHIIFEQPQDRDRAESSCISMLALLANRYEIFTRPQDLQSRLRRQQWEQLQEIITWVRPTIDEIHAVLVLLAIRALGKSKFVLCQVPSHNRRPESAVLYLVDYSSNVVPSIKELSENGLRYVKLALQLHEAFNFAQMLQGENVPANVAQLQEQVSRQGEQSIRFYILFLLGFMSGLEAGSGSRFLTAQRAENVIEAIAMLQHLLDATPRGIYWGYLSARARALNLPHQTPEDLVLVRISCLMRIHPENNCFGQLVTAWNRLGEAEKMTLTDHFLADGIDEVAFVFEFLPDCVANAMKNPIVTLLGLLEILEELLQTLQPAVAMNPDLVGAKVINVDLADMSEFIACVQNHFVFETCVSRCKIRFAGRRAQCEMTGGNWGRIHEADSDLTSLAYCVRDVMQRQQTVESHLSKLQKASTPKAPTFSI